MGEFLGQLPQFSDSLGHNADYCRPSEDPVPFECFILDRTRAVCDCLAEPATGPDPLEHPRRPGLFLLLLATY